MLRAGRGDVIRWKVSAALLVVASAVFGLQGAGSLATQRQSPARPRSAEADRSMKPG